MIYLYQPIPKYFVSLAKLKQPQKLTHLKNTYTTLPYCFTIIYGIFKEFYCNTQPPVVLFYRKVPNNTLVLCNLTTTKKRRRKGSLILCVNY